MATTTTTMATTALHEPQGAAAVEGLGESLQHHSDGGPEAGAQPPQREPPPPPQHVEDTSPVAAAASETQEPASSATASPAAAGTKNNKKYYGLGSYLPKVPSFARPGKSSTSPAGTTTDDPLAAADDCETETVAELRSLPDQQQPTPMASRLRGLSLEQNNFASSLVRRFSTFRQSSTGESPRNSVEGEFRGSGRRSLTGSNVPSPRSDPTLKARRGACVATRFGTGTVLDVRLDDGFYIVELVPKSLAYLREDMIIREIKSVVGERVKTRWGLATVEQYYVDEDMYSIALDWRWDDDHVWRMKATTKKFEKIPRGNSLVNLTKSKLFEGYSTIRESASYGYANVAAKINTTTATYKTGRQTAHEDEHHDLGKALTPYGVCTVLEVRPDQFFVVQTKCGATAYMHADSVKLLHRRTHFADGERVKTPYGPGEVIAYRDEDEVYEVKLDFAVSMGSLPPTLYISDVHAETMMVSSNANQNYARISSLFSTTRNSLYTASATMKASASGSLNTLSNVKAKVSTMAQIRMIKLKYQKGERVITSFGSGFVLDARPLDRIYEVNLRRLKFKGYFHESALAPFPYERVTHIIVDGKSIPAPEMPRNLPEHKRRTIINAAIKQAREGK